MNRYLTVEDDVATPRLEGHRSLPSDAAGAARRRGEVDGKPIKARRRNPGRGRAESVQQVLGRLTKTAAIARARDQLRTAGP